MTAAWPAVVQPGSPDAVARTIGEFWPEPVPFDAIPPPFPSDALPCALRSFVQAEAEATQTPADLAGLLVLAALSTACAGKYVVEVSADWHEPVNLYVVVALPPGTKKSPVFRHVMQPLRDVERQLIEMSAPAVEEARQLRRIAEKRMAKAEDSAGKVSGDTSAGMADAEAARLALAALPEPVALPRLIADDITPERIPALLAEQGGRLAILSEEGGIFATLGGRFSNGVPNLDAVLKAHSCDTIRVDRQGSPPVHVDRPHLTFGLAVQPQVLAGLAKKAEMRGRGLLARFLYALPDMNEGAVRIGHRNLDPIGVPTGVRLAYTQLVSDLALDLPSQPTPLGLSGAAVSMFRGFRERVEPRRDADTGDLAGIVDWSNKLEGQVLRIAALLQLASASASTQIEEPAIRSAIVIADYLIDHSQAAHRLMEASEQRSAEMSRRVLRWLRRNGVLEVSTREVHRALKGSLDFKTVESVGAALEDLRQRGWLRPVPSPDREPGKPGRPSSPRWLLHPLAMPELRRGHPQYPQNHAPAEESA